MIYKYVLKLNINEFPVIGEDELVSFLFGYLYDELVGLDPKDFDAELVTRDIESEVSDVINIYSGSNAIPKINIDKLVNSDKVTLLFDVNAQKVYKGNLFTEEFSGKSIGNKKLSKDLNSLDNSINKTANEIYKEMKRIDRGKGDLSRLSNLLTESNSQVHTKDLLLKSNNINSKLISSIVERIRNNASKYLTDKFTGDSQIVQSLVSETGNNKISRLKEFSDRLKRLT